MAEFQISGLPLETSTTSAHLVELEDTGGISKRATVGSLRGREVNTQVGTTYTILVGDAGRTIRTTSGSAVTITVPLNSAQALPVGTQIEVRQAGAGQVEISPAAGVTLNVNAALTLKIDSQHASAYLHKVDTDEWDVSGLMEPV